METWILLLSTLCAILVATLFVNCERLKRQPGRTPLLSTSQARKPFVVRVTGIPSDAGGATDASEVESWVKTTIGNLANDDGNCISDITIVPSCTDPSELVALVDFTVKPNFLSSLENGNSKSFPTSGTGSRDITFDAHFLDFTQMYPTEGLPVAEYDAPCSKPRYADLLSSIVFMSGIGSHAYGSWTSKSDPWRMWPRHFLPSKLPNARVMIYGHKASLRGTRFGELIDYRRSFSAALEQTRKKVCCLPFSFELVRFPPFSLTDCCRIQNGP